MSAIKLLEYTFDNTIQANCLPMFTGLDSDGYTISDKVVGIITTRTITVNDGINLPTRVWFSDDRYYQGRALLTLDYFDTSNINNMLSLFCYCTHLTFVNTTGWNTRMVTNMGSMFKGCSSLTTLDVSKFDTSNVVYMNNMFRSCTSLSEIKGIGNWDTNKVQTMEWMFTDCFKITTLNLKRWDTSKVKEMGWMFISCKSLTTVDLSNWDTSSVINMNGMFENCSSLEMLDLSNFVTSKTTRMDFMFSDSSSLQILDLSNFNTAKVTDINSIFKNCKIKEIGLIYSNSATVNKIAENLHATSNCDIHYFDAKPSELKIIQNITYVPYKENILYLPPSLTLRSNGDVYDEYNPLTAQLTQRIDEDGSVLSDPVITTVKSIVAYNDTVRYGYELPDQTTDLFHPKAQTYEKVIDLWTLNGTEEWTKVNQCVFTTSFTNAKAGTSTDVLTQKDQIESISIDRSTLTLTFKTDSYVSSNNIGSNALKVWLQSNQVQFKYELKNHTFTHMTLETFNFENAHFVKPQAYKGGGITQSNKDNLIFSSITYQTKSNNRYELPMLERNHEYTLRYKGLADSVTLGGSAPLSIENNCLVQSGSTNEVALFNNEVSNVMLIKKDVREQTFPYFRGLLSTQMPVFLTYGKNLLSQKYVRGKWNQWRGIIEETELYITSDDYIDVSTYTGMVTSSINDGYKYMFALYGKNKEHIYFSDGWGNGFDTKQTFNFKTVAGSKGEVCFVRINLFKKNGAPIIPDEINDIGFQLEYGEVASSYEPHHSNVLSFKEDVTLHSIGNLCDTLDGKTGELVQNIDKIVFDGSENWESLREHNRKNTKRYTLFLNGNIFKKYPTNSLTVDFLSNFKTISPSKRDNDEQAITIIHFGEQQDSVSVRMNKDLITSITDFKQWLSQNPITVQYQLPKPVVKTIDLNTSYHIGNKELRLKTHEEMTHVSTTSETISPTVELEYVTNHDDEEVALVTGRAFSLTDAKEDSFIQGAILKGQTLVNILNNFPTQTYTFTGEWQQKNIAIQHYDNRIKPDTDYTFVFHVSSLKVYDKNKASIEIGTDDIFNNITRLILKEGVNTYKLRSQPNITQNLKLFATPYHTSGSITFTLMLLEGDFTNQDIPYFEGMKSIESPTLKTCGKNLAKLGRYNSNYKKVNASSDGKMIRFNSQSHGSYCAFDLMTGEGISQIIGAEIIDIAYAKSQTLIEGKGSYTLSLDSIVNTSMSIGATICVVYDDGVYKISHLWTGHKKITVEVQNKINFISIDFWYEGASFDITLDNIQLELGSTDSIYEPYKSNTLTTAEGLVMRSNENVYDELNLMTGEFIQRIDENNDVLAKEVVKTVELKVTRQNTSFYQLNYSVDDYGKTKSEGTLPRLTYKLQSTNTFNIPQLKPNTLYTMYSEGEATVAKLGGNSNILLQNPQTITSGSTTKFLTFDSPTSNVVLIEDDVRHHTIPYFTGTLDVINPIIEIRKTNGGNQISQINLRLRSVGNVRDSYNFKTKQFIQRISDQYDVLKTPLIQTFQAKMLSSYTNGTIHLSSKQTSLLPYFQYACRTPNYYQVPIENQATYTIKFDKASNGTLIMGGVTVNTTGNQILTVQDNQVQGILFNQDLGVRRLMVIKGDVRNIPTPYFLGLRSVTNPNICVSNGREIINQLTLLLALRSLPNGLKDELDLITGEFIQRVESRAYQEGDINSSSLMTDGTTTLYPLTTIKRTTLPLQWSEGQLKAYEPTTRVYSETDLLKPLLSFKMPTSTLEILLATLKEKNGELSSQVITLEEENISTMIAITEVFEMMMYIMPSEMATINIAALTNADTKAPKGGFQMVEVYVTLILKGKKTLDQVPAMIRPKVEAQLVELGALEA